ACPARAGVRRAWMRPCWFPPSASQTRSRGGEGAIDRNDGPGPPVQRRPSCPHHRTVAPNFPRCYRRRMPNVTASKSQTGRFVISLDFELMWGVRDKRTIADYGRNILGVRQVVPALLALFAERRIACTWATVGMLFFATKRDLLAALPEQRPRYADPRLSPYHDLSGIGDGEETDPYWYGLSMIKRVMDYPRQEIGTHTFSHFYCLEPGGDPPAFRADLEACAAAAARLGLTLASIVFPRNQTSAAHLSVCRDVGLRAFRGNERIWFHRAGSGDDQTLLRRGFRLADSFLPLGGA